MESNSKQKFTEESEILGDKDLMSQIKISEKKGKIKELKY